MTMTLRGGGQCTDLCCGAYVKFRVMLGNGICADPRDIAVLFVSALSGSSAAARSFASTTGGEIARK